MNRLTNLYHLIVRFFSSLLVVIEHLSRDETRKQVEQVFEVSEKIAVRLNKFQRENFGLFLDTAKSVQAAIESAENVKAKLLQDLQKIGEKGAEVGEQYEKDVESILHTLHPSNTVKVSKPKKHRGRPRRCSTPGCRASRLYNGGVEFSDVCSNCFNDERINPFTDEDERAVRKFIEEDMLTESPALKAARKLVARAVEEKEELVRKILEGAKPAPTPGEGEGYR